jgi:hypothetical protein
MLCRYFLEDVLALTSFLEGDSATHRIKTLGRSGAPAPGAIRLLSQEAAHAASGKVVQLVEAAVEVQKLRCTLCGEQAFTNHDDFAMHAALCFGPPSDSFPIAPPAPSTPLRVAEASIALPGGSKAKIARGGGELSARFLLVLDCGGLELLHCRCRSDCRRIVAGGISAGC